MKSWTFKPAPRPASQMGMTLVELLITVAVVGVLMAVGVPEMQSFLQRRALDAQVDTFMNSLRFARSEALKAGTRVSMCISSNPAAATPACSASGADGWAAGWIVFRDLDGDGAVDNGTDIILRVQQSLTRQSGGIANSAATITFASNGLVPGGAANFRFQPKTGQSSSGKSICMAITGRPRIVPGSGTGVCS